MSDEAQGTTQAQEGPMLRLWAACFEERRTILRFLDWCADEIKVELCEWHPGSNWPSPFPGGAQKLLDLYHEIDQQQLDRERVALLDSCRAETAR